MLANTFKDYSLIRNELRDIKMCITRYASGITGGAGLAFVSLGFAARGAAAYSTIAIIAGFTAILVAFVMASLVYKFTSHNRYAGYCKLLIQEQKSIRSTMGDSIDPPELASWEICIGKLRWMDEEVDKQYARSFQKACELIPVEGHSKEEVGEKCLRFSAKGTDSARYRVWEMAKTIVGRGQPSRSWTFPQSTARVFLGLAFILTLALWVCVVFVVETCDWSQAIQFLALASGLTLMQAVAWYSVLARLYEICFGHETINAYCWRFLPIRYAFLESHGIKVRYLTLNRMYEIYNEIGRRDR